MFALSGGLMVGGFTCGNTSYAGAMLFGMFTNEEISWDSHGFGFLVGGVGGYGYFMIELTP